MPVRASKYGEVKMRYRMEATAYWLVVRNVETNCKVAEVQSYYDLRYSPDRLLSLTFKGCDLVNLKGDRVERFTIKDGPDPMERALSSAAFWDGELGYPSLQGRTGERSNPYRVEFLLGDLLADAAIACGRAVIEHLNGGLKLETKTECGKLIAQIYKIWYASRFGSYDSERGVHEAYFADNYRPGSRMGFGAAARHFGMEELNLRFPDLSEAELKVPLSWPLD